MSRRDDNPGRGDPHHPQYDELKIAVMDALIDLITAMAQRVEIKEDPATDESKD